jgi:hypothetical protein
MSASSSERIAAWMQGYASALEIADPKMFRSSIEKLRAEYGYADESEKRVSEGIMSGVREAEKPVQLAIEFPA